MNEKAIITNYLSSVKLNSIKLWKGKILFKTQSWKHSFRGPQLPLHHLLSLLNLPLHLLHFPALVLLLHKNVVIRVKYHHDQNRTQNHTQDSKIFRVWVYFLLDGFETVYPIVDVRNLQRIVKGVIWFVIDRAPTWALKCLLNWCEKWTVNYLIPLRAILNPPIRCRTILSRPLLSSTRTQVRTKHLPSQLVRRLKFLQNIAWRLFALHIYKRKSRRKYHSKNNQKQQTRYPITVQHYYLSLDYHDRKNSP